MTALAEPGDPIAEQLELKVLARLYGEPMMQLPLDLYIPPDALEIFLDSFEGPLDLLLYLIRKQNFNILDIPMAEVTRQYLVYVDQIREHHLELAADAIKAAYPDTVIDHSTFTDPHQLSTGVRDVWVNGSRVIRDNEHTGATPGRIVDGPGRRS